MADAISLSKSIEPAVRPDPTQPHLSRHWSTVVLCSTLMGGAEIFALERLRLRPSIDTCLYCNPSLAILIRQDIRYDNITIKPIKALEALASKITWPSILDAEKSLQHLLTKGGVLMGNLRASAVQLVSSHANKNLVFFHDNTHYLNLKTRWMMTISAQRSLRVFFPCHHAFENLPLRHLLRDKIEVEYFSAYQRHALPKISRNDTLRILNIGRIEPNKNQFLCHAIACELAKHFEHIELTFLGAESLPSYVQQLRSFPRPSNLNIYIKQVTRSEVPELLKKNHFVLHTSLIESMPLVLFEANALGVPFFACHAGGMSEILPQNQLLAIDPAVASQTIVNQL